MIHSFDKHFEKNDGYETEYMKILYYDLSKDFEGEYNSYNYTRVCTIAEGTKQVRINNGNEFTYSKSEFIILPPDSSVHMNIKEPTVAVVYEISDRLIEDTVNKLQNYFDVPVPGDSKVITQLKYDPSIKAQLSRINTYCMGSDPNKDFLIDLSSQELVYTLLKNYRLPTQLKKNREPVQYTIQYFNDHLYNKGLTMKEIAYNLNLSPSSLIAQFKRATGMTPIEYQNSLRIKKSKEDLLNKNVTEVAYDLGFESISYFIKLFKKYYGITPKQYTLLKK